ncbi:MAG: DUF2442 domain-containing protein [Thermoanaerobaculia bacterium]
MHRVVKVRPLEPCQVWLRFEDGIEGVVDLAHSLREGEVLDRLRDPEVFRRVRILRGFGTVEWPGGIDFDPDVLYSRVMSALS